MGGPPQGRLAQPGTSSGQALDRAPRSVPQEGLWRRSPAEKWDRVVLDSYVDGEIPEEAYADMVEEIQGSLGIVGHSSILAGSLTWSPATQTESSRRIVISMIRGEGRTRIRVEEEFEIRGFRRAFVPLGGLAGLLVAAVGDFLMGGIGGSPPALLIPCMGLGVCGRGFRHHQVPSEYPTTSVGGLVRAAHRSCREMRRRRGLARAQGIQAAEGSSTTEFTARVNSRHSARCRSSALDPSSVRVK